MNKEDAAKAIGEYHSRGEMAPANLLAILTRPDNIQCEHYSEGSCKIASSLAGMRVVTTESACATCAKQQHPRAVNPLTCKLASVKAMRHGLYLDVDVADYGNLIVEGERHVSPLGPGTELAKMIGWIWSPRSKCKTCNDRIRKMNMWGPAKCRKRKDLIVEWLRQSAEKAGLPFFRPLVSGVVNLAISSAERRQRLAGEDTFPVENDNSYIVAVTTAPRIDCTLRRCIDSLRRCGWEPTVFAEPGSTRTNARTIENPERLGVWHNWLHASKWCLENSDAPLIMTVQDDSFFHPDSRKFANKCLWPSERAAFLSLYTPKHYTMRRDRSLRPTGVNRIATRSLWGACALIWDRRVLEQVVEHKVAQCWSGSRPRSGSKAVIQKRLDNPSMIANSDDAIGRICRSLGRTFWYVDPSPVQHIAVNSTCGHGGNRGRRNAYRIADHALPLEYQVQPPKTVSLDV